MLEMESSSMVSKGTRYIKAWQGVDRRPQMSYLAPMISAEPQDSAQSLGRPAISPITSATLLADFKVRTVSDLGPVVLLCGSTSFEQVDVVADTRTGELSMIVTSSGWKVPRRPLSVEEAADLHRQLLAQTEGQRLTVKTSLLSVVAEAARRACRN